MDLSEMDLTELYTYIVKKDGVWCEVKSWQSLNRNWGANVTDVLLKKPAMWMKRGGVRICIEPVEEDELLMILLQVEK